MEFVGRVAELVRLETLAADARAGEPHLVLVEGDAGLGKSTLLREAASRITDARVLRASADETESSIAFGVIDQLMGGVRRGDAQDAPAVGALLLQLLGELQAEHPLVVIVIDDLHWCDGQSAQALLFAFRRLHGDKVLILTSARPVELARLGGSWTSGIGTEHGTVRLRLNPMTSDEVGALANAIGVVGLSAAAAGRLREHTGGSPIHCRALLEELDVSVLNRMEAELPVPRALAAVISTRVAGLPTAAQAYVHAAAILGLHSPTTLVNEVAELDEPTIALDALVAAGMVTEADRTGQRNVVFTHALVRQAIYDDLSPSKRRALHARAGALTTGAVSLQHRAAAAAGPNDALAAELYQAGSACAQRNAYAEATTLFLRAAELSEARTDREFNVMEALGTSIDGADFAVVESLLPIIESFEPSVQRSAALGTTAMTTAQFDVAKRHLTESWERETVEPKGSKATVAGATMGVLSFVVGDAEQGVKWGRATLDHGTAVPGFRQHILNFYAANLATAGRIDEALAVFAPHAEEPGDIGFSVPRMRVFRGVTRMFADDIAGAVRDLLYSRAAHRSGIAFDYDTHGLMFLVDACFRAGQWDEAAVHADFAVSLAHDADRLWDFGFAHANAALVPAARGELDDAREHIAQAAAWGDGLGIKYAAAMAATAHTLMLAAQQDWDDVLGVVDHVRSLGNTDALGRPGMHGWRHYEVEALLALGRHGEAAQALEEFATAIPSAGHLTSELQVARLRGDFAAGDGLRSRVPQPFAIAEFDLAAGIARRDVAGVQRARSVFERLGAAPFLARCDAALADLGAKPTLSNAPAFNLTPTETVVARLVSEGRTNQEVATELFVSVKAIEFHMSNILAKLGIKSRRQIAATMHG